MSEFSRSVRLFVRSNLSPEVQAAALAAFAREDVARLQREGRASLRFAWEVDGREGAQPEAVRPGGRIVARFNGIAEAAAFALSFCVARSPVLEGIYRKSWVVLVDGREWTRPLPEIPSGSEVLVVNTQPYHRKIDMGSQGAGALGREVASARGGSRRKRGAYVSITDACRQELLRRFPGVSAGRVFVELPSGPAPAPYVMKGGRVSARRMAVPKARGTGFRKRRVTFAPRFSRAGEPMTYPAVSIAWGG